MNNLTFYKYPGAKWFILIGLIQLIFVNVLYFSELTNNNSNFLTDITYYCILSPAILTLFIGLFHYSQIVILNFDAKIFVIKNRFTRKRRELPFISFTDTWATAARNGGYLIYASTIEKRKISLFFQQETDYYRLLREGLEKETGRLFPLNLGKPLN